MCYDLLHNEINNTNWDEMLPRTRIVRAGIPFNNVPHLIEFQERMAEDGLSIDFMVVHNRPSMIDFLSNTLIFKSTPPLIYEKPVEPTKPSRSLKRRQAHEYPAYRMATYPHA